MVSLSFSVEFRYASCAEPSLLFIHFYWMIFILTNLVTENLSFRLVSVWLIAPHYHSILSRFDFHYNPAIFSRNLEFTFVRFFSAKM